MKSYIRKIVQKAGWDFKRIDQIPEWPQPSCSTVTHPFLILLTPQNSGSTAIAQYVCSSENIEPLYERNCEGQWLVKGLRKAQWNPNAYVNWASVATVWEREGDLIKNKKPVEFFFEKSPTNIVRIDDFLKIFVSKKVVVNIRNPIATISSQLKRYKKNYPSESRSDILKHYAFFWINISSLLMKCSEKFSFPVIRYEDFCTNPKLIFDAFAVDNEVPINAVVSVKDYPAQGIQNMNESQLSELSESEYRMVKNILTRAEVQLAYFDYKI